MYSENVSQDLLQKCINGNNSSWIVLVDSYIGVVYKSVISILNKYYVHIDENDMQDICQNTFLKLFLKDCKVLKQYNPEKSSFSTWLTVIARNTAIDFLRKRKERNASIEEIIDELHVQHMTDSGKINIPEDVVSARQHLVLRMMYDDGLEVDDVAKFLSVKRQTIRSLHHRAMKKLRAYYDLESKNQPDTHPESTTQT